MTRASRAEQLPVPFGDDLDGAVDQFDRGSTIPNVSSSPAGGFQRTKSSPMLGAITMLPALSPTQTVSVSDGSRSASPHCRIQ